MKLDFNFEFLRSEIVGIDASFATPFGQRIMTYCDYTASGRCLAFVERYIMRLQRNYANTHTEDDITGRSMSRLLQSAEDIIKSAVNAGDGGKLIAVGTGATGAISKFQQLIGVRLPPASRALLETMLSDPEFGLSKADFARCLEKCQPVVFVGPYEHHSNEISWREGMTEVVEIGMDAKGHIDLADLEAKLSLPNYQGRFKIGSFSAASNVTGLISPVTEISALLKAHGALVCFDFAASAPYVEIDMNPDGGTAIDAIFLSPHKFLGGPGASGVLIFNQAVYHSELPPSVAGGGTVDYVGPHSHDFMQDIEERERAGTPGVLQTIRAAMAFSVKTRVGLDNIKAREHAMLAKAMRRWQQHPGVEILGDHEPCNRIAIVSFNLKDPRGGFLHPKFLTVALNDLFGIQSRAGCSCAGPYGHRLLGIDDEVSERYRSWVKQGCHGIKPGWCRIGFHFTMDDEEVEFVIRAVEFMAERGHCFLPFYRFDLHSASWTHVEDAPECQSLCLDAAISAGSDCAGPLPNGVRADLYRSYLATAEELATKGQRDLRETPTRLEGELGELQFFTMD